MLNWKRVQRLQMAAIATAMLAAGVSAQSVTQGAITGTVEDVSGAAVAKATVVIVNTATNQTLTLTADEKGFFDAPLLQPGTYKVTISAPGFSQYLATSVTVNVSAATTLEPRLNTGNASETVTVNE